jgi:4-amino-4-deoxy-L-arabinose transferase-like glycosyltransferase
MTERLLSLGWWRARAAAWWSTPEARWLTAIALLALALRVVWVLYAARQPQQLHDPLFYALYGERIARGYGYTTISDEPTAYYPIGYPAMLAALFAVVLHTPIPDNLIKTAAFFQVFLGVATVVLVYHVARRLFGATVGLLAALWIAVFPNLIYHTAAILSETLFNFLVLAALAVLFWSGWPRGRLERWQLIAFGALIGLSALVRPISLLFLPLLPAVWLWAGAGWRRASAQTGLVLVTAVAVIAPWSIRNFIVMDAPVIISANLGDDLCMGHYPGATGTFGLPDYCFAGYDNLKRPEYEVRRNNDNIRKAIRFAIHHPRTELKLLSRKAYWLWNHDHDGISAVESYGDDPFINPHLRTALYRIADIFFFTTISLGGLGLAGFVLPPRDPRRVFALLALLTLAGVPLVFFTDARFHVPAMPLLSIAAAWAVVAAARNASRLAAQMMQGGGPPGSGVEVAEGERPVADQDAL